MLAITVAGGGRAGAAQAPVGLGTAAGFAVIAGTTVTNTGPSIISGDLGVSPGTAVTGFPPGVVSNGAIHAADALAAQAQADVTTAYNDAAGRAVSATVTADLGGQTLVAGVYTGGALSLTGTLTLDAQNDPNAVFVFQAASTLITASSSTVRLVGAANPCNVYWKVGSSATLGTNSTFVGTVLALTSVSATTGASVTGRLFARNAAVTLDSNTINRPTCAASTSTTTTTTATGATTSTTGSAATTTSVAGATTTTTAAAAGGTTSTTIAASGATTAPTSSTSVGVSPTTIPAASVPPTVGTIAPTATRAPAATPGTAATGAAVAPTGTAPAAVATAEGTLAYTGTPLAPLGILGALAVLFGAVLVLPSRPMRVRRGHTVR